MAQEEKTPRTRQQVMTLLKSSGRLDAASLAEQLGVSAMAVRQHLYDLQEHGLVTYEEASRPVGRPAKLWQLTDAAQEFFPDAHAELAVGLISAMRQAIGEDGVGRVLAARAKDQVEAYRQGVGSPRSLRKRLAALAKLRSAEGYMASVESAGRGRYLFIENHCPVCTAASACTGICAAELDVFQKTLGAHTKVERTDHILAGARRCAYLVEKR